LAKEQWPNDRKAELLSCGYLCQRPIQAFLYIIHLLDFPGKK